LLVAVSPAAKRAALYRAGEIVHSDQPYAAADFANKHVHDTHRKSSTWLQFPQDFPGPPEAAEAFFAAAVAHLRCACAVAMPDVRWYEESEGGFEILG